jgi:GNAT superfamily N-acetyltransferase
MANDVQELYESIKAKGGTILSPAEDKEWDLCEMLVQDPDGHVIRFGQHSQSAHMKSSGLPDAINIVDRIPTVEEYEELIKAVGWKPQTRERTTAILKAPVFAAVAEDVETKRTVGCVLLLGDDASFYYVKDMMVHPDYQRKHIGSALMQKLNDWIETHGPDDVLVGLYTGENLAPFYREFGFRESFGMSRRF